MMTMMVRATHRRQPSIITTKRKKTEWVGNSGVREGKRERERERMRENVNTCSNIKIKPATKQGILARTTQTILINYKSSKEYHKSKQGIL